MTGGFDTSRRARQTSGNIGRITMNKPIGATPAVQGEEHWTKKGDVRLFLWEKRTGAPEKAGTILFVHGSSMASQPTFDLQVPGMPDASAMDYFASKGFDT